MKRTMDTEWNYLLIQMDTVEDVMIWIDWMECIQMNLLYTFGCYEKCRQSSTIYFKILPSLVNTNKQPVEWWCRESWNVFLVHQV